MKWYISKNYRHLGSAGDKAKTDIEAILNDIGYHNAGLAQGKSKSSVKAYFITLTSVVRGVMRLKKGDILVLQYPLKKYYDFVVRRAVAKGVNIVTIIHDLGSFRRRKLTVEEEIKRLSLSSVVIVHTENMRKWLSDNGMTAPMVVLGLFDYLSDTRCRSEMRGVDKRPALMFAGNCSKHANGWIYKLGESTPEIDVELYGNGVDPGIATPNLKAHGHTESDVLISTAEGNYGVAWYGNSLDGGEGALGEYLQYNSPHKISLYLRAGLPVIIWNKAGLAGVIKRLGVGISVPSLRDIDKVLAEISPEQYRSMRRNAFEVSSQLSRGESVKSAIRKAEEIISNQPSD